MPFVMSVSVRYMQSITCSHPFLEMRGWEHFSLSDVQKITSAILLQIFVLYCSICKGTMRASETAEAARAEAKPLLSAVAESGLYRVVTEEDAVKTKDEIQPKR